MDEIDKTTRTVTLRDDEGHTRLFSPKDTVRERVTLYHDRDIGVAVGDRMCFSKSDVKRGYVANSTWTVTLSPCRMASRRASCILRHSRRTGMLTLAYAVTAHGAQEVSERFCHRPGRGRRQTRAKAHVQVYTNDQVGSQKAASTLYGKTPPLYGGGATLGRAVLRASGLSGHSLAHFVAPGKKNPQPHAILPAYDANGRQAGAWLAHR